MVSNGLAVLPLWVVPPPGEVADAHRIAHALARDTGEIRWKARAATLDWVTGGQDSAPVTARPRDREPTAAVAAGEMLVADCVATGATMADEMWDRLGVDPLPAATNQRGWADSDSVMLGWLLGRRKAPIRVPRRNPDGSVMTADQLYVERAAARYSLPPEERAALRNEAAADAELYRRLAALASSV